VKKNTRYVVKGKATGNRVGTEATRDTKEGAISKGKEIEATGREVEIETVTETRETQSLSVFSKRKK